MCASEIDWNSMLRETRSIRQFEECLEERTCHLPLKRRIALERIGYDIFLETLEAQLEPEEITRSKRWMRRRAKAALRLGMTLREFNDLDDRHGIWNDPEEGYEYY